MSSAPVLPPDRQFGFLMAAIAAGIGAWLLWKGAASAPAWGCLLLAAALLGVALVRPSLLRPVNRAWMKLGELMGRLVNPLVLGAIFFLLLTPTAWVARLSGRDVLGLRSRRHLPSYWVVREPAGPAPDSFKYQF